MLLYFILQRFCKGISFSCILNSIKVTGSKLSIVKDLSIYIPHVLYPIGKKGSIPNLSEGFRISLLQGSLGFLNNLLPSLREVGCIIWIKDKCNIPDICIENIFLIERSSTIEVLHLQLTDFFFLSGKHILTFA